MIGQSSQDAFRIVQAFILSTLIHSIVVSVFVFKLPVKPEPHKPNFIFLGSILQNQYFTNTEEVYSGSENTDRSTTQWISGMLELTEKPFADSKPNKPIKEYQTPNPKSKRTLKSTFLETESELSEPPADIGVETELAPYKPFKFHIQ